MLGLWMRKKTNGRRLVMSTIGKISNYLAKKLILVVEESSKKSVGVLPSQFQSMSYLSS